MGTNDFVRRSCQMREADKKVTVADTCSARFHHISKKILPFEDLQTVRIRCPNDHLYPFVKTTTVRRCFCCHHHRQTKNIAIVISLTFFLCSFPSQQHRERTKPIFIPFFGMYVHFLLNKLLNSITAANADWERTRQTSGRRCGLC
jgi:hypothetical protein